MFIEKSESDSAVVVVDVSALLAFELLDPVPVEGDGNHIAVQAAPFGPVAALDDGGVPVETDLRTEVVTAR